MTYLGATELTLPGGASIGANTPVLNIGQVASIIFEFEGDVDGYAAAAGYAVPITATVASYAYASMRRAVRNGVTAYVLETFFPNLGGPADKTSSAAAYKAAYDAFVKSLKDGSLALVGAPMSGEGSSGRAAPAAGGVCAPIDLCTRF